MSRTITAMFDTRADAEAAKARLSASNFGATHVDIVDQSSTGATGTATEGGFWHSLKEMFVADDDRHAYGEGIRRGGFLLSAEVDERNADQAIAMLTRRTASISTSALPTGAKRLERQVRRSGNDWPDRNDRPEHRGEHPGDRGKPARRQA